VRAPLICGSTLGYRCSAHGSNWVSVRRSKADDSEPTGPAAAKDNEPSGLQSRVLPLSTARFDLIVRLAAFPAKRRRMEGAWHHRL
jgi:hypothetical protein